MAQKKKKKGGLLVILIVSHVSLYVAFTKKKNLLTHFDLSKLPK